VASASNRDSASILMAELKPGPLEKRIFQHPQAITPTIPTAFENHDVPAQSKSQLMAL
jgi:hypothetical protein